jgi:curli production assembly/transport component CsgF
MRRMALFLLAALPATAAQAGELVYQPINPAFGGNPLNGTILLNEANAQNDFSDPDARASATLRTQQSALEQFNQSLQRAILNRVAASLTGNVVDSNGNLIPGIVETSDFLIQIVDRGNGVLEVTTTDKTTGQTTTFQVSG